MNVEFSPEAIDDLSSTLELIASRDERAAERIAQHIWDLLELLLAQGIDGPKSTIRWRGRRIVIRSWPVHPFRLFYQRTGDGLKVLRALHHARKPIARR